MGEEERRRKIIIDAAAALVRSMECMRNTLLLARGGADTTNEQVMEFKTLADELARKALDIEHHCAEGGYGSTSEGAPGGRD